MLPTILYMLVVIRTVVKYNSYRPKFVSKKREYLWLVVVCWRREVGLSDWCITSGTPLIIDFPSSRSAPYVSQQVSSASRRIVTVSALSKFLAAFWHGVYSVCSVLSVFDIRSALYFYSVRITGILIRLPFMNSTSVSSPPPIINAPQSIFSRTGKGNEQLPLSRESRY